MNCDSLSQANGWVKLMVQQSERNAKPREFVVCTKRMENEFDPVPEQRGLESPEQFGDLLEHVMVLGTTRFRLCAKKPIGEPTIHDLRPLSTSPQLSYKRGSRADSQNNDLTRLARDGKLWVRSTAIAMESEM